VENTSHTFYVLITMTVIITSYSTERERESKIYKMKFRSKRIMYGTKKVKIYEEAK
jgi:hypothetical protein